MQNLKLMNGRPLDETGRLDKEIRVYDILDKLQIEYERIDHEEANTMEACIEIDKALEPAVVCKNLFLVNSAGTEYYLLMLRGDKKFKTAIVSKQIGATRLSFGTADKMEEYLDITPGSVSVMGLMNDTTNKVNLLIDSDILENEYVGCHPCINTSSLRLKTKDLIDKFLKEIKHDYVVVNV